MPCHISSASRRSCSHSPATRCTAQSHWHGRQARQALALGQRPEQVKERCGEENTGGVTDGERQSTTCRSRGKKLPLAYLMGGKRRTAGTQPPQWLMPGRMHLSATMAQSWEGLTCCRLWQPVAAIGKQLQRPCRMPPMALLHPQLQHQSIAGPPGSSSSRSVRACLGPLVPLAPPTLCCWMTVHTRQH